MTLRAAALVAAVLLAFAPALGAGFVWDDDTHLLDNPVFEADGLRRVWTSPPEKINYWPLTYTSYWIEHRLWGFEPFGYHAVNLALHTVNALLLWAVLLRLGVPAAWFAALVFAVHPVNVDSVAWIAQRKTLLSFCFAALALLAYLRFDARRDATSYAAALASHLLALLAKGAAAPLPAVLLLCAWWRRGRVALRDVVPTLPFFALTAGMSLLEISGQNLVGATTPGIDGPLDRLVGAAWSAWFYLGKAMAPFGLSFVYPRFDASASSLLHWLPLLALGALAGVAWGKRASWGRPLVFAGGGYLLWLSPVLGFFDIFYLRFASAADHYQYLALPAVVALLVGATAHALARAPAHSRNLRVAAAVLLVGALAASSAAHSSSYRDAERLWRDTLARNPDAFLARYNLAHLLHAERRLDEAAAEYGAALRLRPDAALAHNNLGRIRQDQGRTQEALEHYRRALEHDASSLEARNNLAVLLQQLGQHEAALRHYRAAIRNHPRQSTLWYNAALLLERLGRVDAAIEHYRKAVSLAPDSPQGRGARARVDTLARRSTAP